MESKHLEAADGCQGGGGRVLSWDPLAFPPP